jgi:hypothetical protein
MSVYEGSPFDSDPVLRLLDGELETAARGITEWDVAKDRFEATPVLLDLGEVPPNTFVMLDTTHEETGVATFRFFRAPPSRPDIAEWYWVPDGWEPGAPLKPVMMAGSRMGNTLLGEHDVVRQGYKLSFYEVAQFRSSHDLPPGCMTTGLLPAPEQLDRHMFATLLRQGLIVRGERNRFLWRIPTEAHETGLVINAWATPLE